MSKKSLIASLVVGVMLTLSLGLYALISTVMAHLNPKHDLVTLAYTSDQAETTGISFGNYSEAEGNLKLTFDGEEFVEYNSEEKVYKLVPNAYGQDAKTCDELKFTAVATTDAKIGSTCTYTVSIFKQGDGENDYVVANTDSLLQLAEQSYNGKPVVTNDNFVVYQVADIDLAGKDWFGIGTDREPFRGTYNANGHKVKNMTINVTATNYADYLDLYEEGGINYKTMALGFFPTTNGATINGLSITDAKITIAPEVYELVNSDDKILWIRAGLLTGFARNTVVNGNYANAGENAVYSQITGSIQGFTVANNGRMAGLGGMIGQLDDVADQNNTDTTVSTQKTTPSSIACYDVNVAITNIADVYGVAIASQNDHIGGVVGVVRGHQDTTAISNLKVSLTSTIKYNDAASVGGIVGWANNIAVNAQNGSSVVVTLNVKDESTSRTAFETWLNSSNFDDAKLALVGGVAAELANSSVKNVNVNANITNCYSYNAAGVATMKNSVLTDVCTTGDITGYAAGGVVGNAYVDNNGESLITYTAAEEGTEKVVVNITLNGWFTAGVVLNAENTSIVGNGTKVVAVINNYGKADLDTNNTNYSAGAVGYFYTTDASNTYKISGLNVNATINNGIDMAGLVCYLGNDNTAYTNTQNVVENCIVVANLNSPVTSGTTNSTAHKVGGAVATVYGSATLDNLDVTVYFNNAHRSGYNYGAAMFGGLVARIAGLNVQLTNNKVGGYAYINNAAYAKFFNDNALYQLLVGGLVGAIADYGVDVAAGEHPTTDNNRTIDNLNALAISNSNMLINANVVAITLDIPYVAQQYQGTLPENVTNNKIAEGGYKARALGALIGLVMNAENSSLSGVYTFTSLIGNNTVDTKILNVNAESFRFLDARGTLISSRGYGYNINSQQDQTPCVVGISFSFINGQSYDIFNENYQIDTTPSIPDSGNDQDGVETPIVPPVTDEDNLEEDNQEEEVA